MLNNASKNQFGSNVGKNDNDMAAQHDQSYDSEVAVQQHPFHHHSHCYDHGNPKQTRNNDECSRCNNNDGQLRCLDHITENNLTVEREQRQLAYTLGQKSIPPLACQLLKKKVNY